MWEQMVTISFYTYRDFSDDEINAYISFLESDVGKFINDLSVVCYAKIIADFLEVAIPRIEAAANKFKEGKEVI